MFNKPKKEVRETMLLRLIAPWGGHPAGSVIRKDIKAAESLVSQEYVAVPMGESMREKPPMPTIPDIPAPRLDPEFIAAENKMAELLEQKRQLEAELDLAVLQDRSDSILGRVVEKPDMDDFLTTGEFPPEPPDNVQTLQRKVSVLEKAIVAQDCQVQSALNESCRRYCENIKDDLTVVHTEVVRAAVDFLDAVEREDYFYESSFRMAKVGIKSRPPHYRPLSKAITAPLGQLLFQARRWWHIKI